MRVTMWQTGEHHFVKWFNDRTKASRWRALSIYLNDASALSCHLLWWWHIWMLLVEQASFAGIAFALARIHVDSLLLGKSVTTYWCVPGMFFGDKRVTDPKIEQNDNEFEINVNRNTVCEPSKDCGNQTTIWGTSLTTSLTGLGFQKSNKRVPVKGLRREKEMSRK